MKAEGLRAARVAQSASAIVVTLTGLAAAGFALTDFAFDPREALTAPRATTQTGPIATTQTAPTTTTHTVPTTTTNGSPVDVGAATSTGVWTILLLVLAGAVLIAAASAAIALRRRRLRQRVDREIATVAVGGSTVGSVTQSVLHRQTTPGQEGKLIRQRASRHLVDTHARAALDVDFLYLLPQRPRSVKRAVNDLLLRIAMAVQNDLLTERSLVHATELAKWVVLRHRWPELAAAIESRPELLDELEEATDEDALHAALRRANLSIADLDDVFALIRHEPRLAPVLGALTHFDPTPASAHG